MKADKYKTLDIIANGFRAANQIKNIQKEPVRSEISSSVSSSNAEMLQEMIKTIAQYSPDTYRGPLNDTLQRASTYSVSYKNMKQHLNTMKDEGFNKDQLMRMLAIMQPVVDTHKKLIIDKILKIYDIINS